MPPIRKHDRPAVGASDEASPEQTLSDYVAELNRQYADDNQTIIDVRRVIDGALGTQSLTALFYESRNEGGPELR